MISISTVTEIPPGDMDRSTLGLTSSPYTKYPEADTGRYIPRITEKNVVFLYRKDVNRIVLQVKRTSYQIMLLMSTVWCYI